MTPRLRHIHIRVEIARRMFAYDYPDGEWALASPDRQAPYWDLADIAMEAFTGLPRQVAR